ncbi:MAG: hypothetical protein M3499_02750 [Actinomycetota bacterium]|nr:hypothetical protein [Actinomycetota bacterium]
MARAEQHVKDSQRLIAEVAEDEALLSDLAAGLGAPRLSRARVDPIGNKAGSKFRPERIRIYWRA